MRFHVPTFGVAVISVAVVLWTVGLWYHMSKPVIINTAEHSGWIYPVTGGRRSLGARSDVVVHLRFSSNASTTVYIEYSPAMYSSERFEFASNITFLDTRFVAEELGVSSMFFYFVFYPATEPATMNLLITYEIPNNFYYIYIFLGMGFAGLGALDLANAFWKRQPGAKKQNNKSGARSPVSREKSS